jgi:hypothetical protein
LFLVSSIDFDYERTTLITQNIACGKGLGKMATSGKKQDKSAEALTSGKKKSAPRKEFVGVDKLREQAELLKSYAGDLHSLADEISEQFPGVEVDGAQKFITAYKTLKKYKANTQSGLGNAIAAAE